ncbi:MAG: sulfur carrier protein ThiS [Nitrospirota bacterium]|nr:sulfur carrier protein ThiS [Nitrospirota bacterium]
MTIQLNGERRTLNEPVTVGALLRSLNLQSDKVAVEVNLEILDKQEFEARGLQDGDQVEVMSFVGGGCVLEDE